MPEPKTYQVVWRIDVDAATPGEAAEKARGYQVAADTTAIVFDVNEEGSDDVYRVDLSECTIDLLTAGGDDDVQT